MHLFQFADDAAVISGQENENQVLLNRILLYLILQEHGYQRTLTILSHLIFVDGLRFLSVEPQVIFSLLILSLVSTDIPLLLSLSDCRSECPEKDTLKSHVVSFPLLHHILCQNLALSGLLFSQICQRIYLLSLSDTSITHFLLGKISQNGAFLPPLIVVFA